MVVYSFFTTHGRIGGLLSPFHITRAECDYWRIWQR